MKFFREFLYLILSILEVVIVFLAEIFKIIEFIFSNIFKFVILPGGILALAGYFIYIVFSWGGLGYKYALDFFSEDMIYLKCENNKRKMRYYKVNGSPFSEDPLYLKFFSLKKKQIVPIAQFSNHRENDKVYEFKSSKNSYLIDRKSLILKNFDIKTKKIKFTRECFQLTKDKFNQIIDDIKNEGKKF